MQLIVNVTQNWGIGYQNELLVPIRADLKRFRQFTTGKTVILGRSTLATFPGGQPLKNRRNLVLSRQENLTIAGAEVLHSIEQLLDTVKTLPPEDVWVIGGASIYCALLDYCDAAYITKTYCTRPADCFFPDLDLLSQWQLTGRSDMMEEDGIQFEYLDFRNTSPKPLP